MVSLDALSFVHGNLSSHSLDNCSYTSKLAFFLDSLRFHIFGKYGLFGYVADFLDWVVYELTELFAVVQGVALEFGKIREVVCLTAPLCVVHQGSTVMEGNLVDPELVGSSLVLPSEMWPSVLLCDHMYDQGLIQRMGVMKETQPVGFRKEEDLL